MVFYTDPLVLQTQRCYRALLSAMSRPGVMARLEERKVKRSRVCGIPEVLMAACECLLDEQVTVGGLGEAGEEWAREISKELRVPLADLCEADFVLAAAVQADRSMSGIKQGTFLAPEEAGTLFLYVEERIDGKAGLLEFQGPGVSGKLFVGVSPPVLDWAFQRQGIPFEYPLGFDVFLMDSAWQVLGIPRSCSLGLGKFGGE